MKSLPGVLRRVTYPYALSPTFDRFRTHPTLMKVIRSLLGDDVVQLVNQVNFNPPGLGTGWGWHQDYRFRRQGVGDMAVNFVQTIIAIDHSSQRNGGIRLVPGSFKLGALTLDLDVENAEQHFDATTAITPALEPGDAVLFNPYVIHGSTANQSSEQRRIYINGFARRSACPEHGIPVLAQGAVVAEPKGFMEFENDPGKLPLAAKY